MKKLSIICVIALLLLSCNNKKYQATLDETIDRMDQITNTSVAISSTYIKVWRTAIYDNEYEGEYCSDFNEALAKHMEFIQGSETYKNLVNRKNTADSLMIVLRDYPSSYKEAFDEIVSIYADVDEVYKNAMSPDGSLSSFSEKAMRNYDSTTKRIKAFKIKYATPQK